MKLTSLEIARVADLGQPKATGTELAFRCPNHDDRRPSLLVNPSKNAWMCGPCGIGGGAWDLAAFIARCNPSDKESVVAWLREHGLLHADRQRNRQIVKTYPYRDESGHLLFEVVRFEPKSFAQRRPDGAGGWIWNLDGVRLVPYRLNEFFKRRTVYISEGEKDADALWQLGIPATTNPMGAGKWRAEFNRYFASKSVVIIPDSDQVGMNHARQVARSLFPFTKAIKIVELPGLPPKGDVSDWLKKTKSERN